MPGLTERLPAEIVLLICEHLAADSTHSLLQLCLTSKALYELTYPILYQDVRLKSHYGPHSSLLRFSRHASSHENDLQSIDIRFTRGHMSAFLTGIPSAFTNLQPTAALLPKLTQLRTFILRLEHHDKRNARLPDKATSLLLKSLPESVRNLELDTEGSDQLTWQEQRWAPEECFCDALAGVLPQLHHIRLRKGYLCSNIFKGIKDAIASTTESKGQQAWPLRSLTIRLDLEREWMEAPAHSASCQRRAVSIEASSLANPVREGIEAGLFPALEHAVIISRFGDIENLRTAKGTRHSGFAIHNVVKNSTTLIPVLAVEIDCKLPLGRNHEASSKFADVFLVRDLDGVDRFASYSELASALERNRPFRDVIGSPTAQPYEFDFSCLDLREQATLPSNMRMSIWDREAKVGQILLSAKELQGLITSPRWLNEFRPPG
ncbi:uncharacterized protein PV09_03881 [Verruconis gallopava]|uniref:F-box domain-containing protein n=1 Tax=Verruconis gallopava TaxID=253628 RepID=A0A0D2AFU1_9PEZI|nr:uncharacterized protein PV09_03881 [Verruconis gallopava]KIW05365.1 hypothetical protein PV09_03881 [Verruconis gallopava]